MTIRFPILAFTPPEGRASGRWSARLVHYPFGERGVPDPAPGFRSVGEGATLEEAVRKLIAEVASRPENRVAM